MMVRTLVPVDRIKIRNREKSAVLQHPIRFRNSREQVLPIHQIKAKSKINQIEGLAFERQLRRRARLQLNPPASQLPVSLRHGMLRRINPLPLCIQQPADPRQLEAVRTPDFQNRTDFIPKRCLTLVQPIDIRKLFSPFGCRGIQRRLVSPEIVVALFVKKGLRLIGHTLP